MKLKNYAAKTLVTAFALTTIVSGCSVLPQTNDTEPAKPELKSEEVHPKKSAPKKTKPFKGREMIA